MILGTKKEMLEREKIYLMVSMIHFKHIEFHVCDLSNEAVQIFV